MPRTLIQATGFLLGFWIALSLAPMTVSIARADDVPYAELEARLHREINAIRMHKHLVLLERRRDLDRVARIHSEDMARRGYLSHENPEGRSPLDRISTGASDGFTLAAENLGTTDRGDSTREILDGWLASPVHRQNLLAPPFNATGIGVARNPDGAWVYTQVYVTYPQ